MGFPFKRVRPRQRHVPGTMNKTEKAYAERLDLLQRAGEIRSWKFESVKFKLADKTYYTPDFMVVTEEQVEFHDTKGSFVEDDFMVKVKVVAEMYPEFCFKLVEAKYTDRDGLRIIKVTEY